ncbi:MAG TPA: A/G-specific adenine glycosylase [Prolixibacteraceae bacterium]|nr:A/G-specific adenine glycosylase [Prolixibacteraceae bacterium]
MFLDFSKKILSWYQIHKRELPWRNETTAYRIWLSEIIMQQTRIRQGLPYYLRFVSLFPTVDKLAEAREEEVLKAWQGLGYYTRARNLHAAARQVVESGRAFPTSYRDLLGLKGVGEYTAAAIASIVSGEKVPAIDGNVVRVLSRYGGIFEPAGSSKNKQAVAELARKLISPEQPGDFNQALMDLGAIICTPTQTRCDECPLKETCFARKQGVVSSLPVQKRKPKIRTRYFHYIVIETGSQMVIHQRTSNDIWRNLFEFPLIETEQKALPETVLHSDLCSLLLSGCEATLVSVSDTQIHRLSHQILKIRFYHLQAKDVKKLPEQFLFTDKMDIFDFPVPRIIEEYLENKKTGLRDVSGQDRQKEKQTIFPAQPEI